MIQRVKFFPGVTSSDDKVLMAPANFAALVYKYKLRKKKNAVRQSRNSSGWVVFKRKIIFN